MTSLLTGVDCHDKSGPREEDISPNDDDFEDDCLSFEYTPTNENVDLEKMPFSIDGSFENGYAAEILVRVSTGASKRLAQELLRFLHASTLNVKNYQRKLPHMSKCKTIYKRSVHDRFDGINLKFLFLTYQFQHELEKKHEFCLENSVEFLKKQLSLTEAHHLFT